MPKGRGKHRSFPTLSRLPKGWTDDEAFIWGALELECRILHTSCDYSEAMCLNHRLHYPGTSLEMPLEILCAHGQLPHYDITFLFKESQGFLGLHCGGDHKRKPRSLEKGLQKFLQREFDREQRPTPVDLDDEDILEALFNKEKIIDSDEEGSNDEEELWDEQEGPWDEEEESAGSEEENVDGAEGHLNAVVAPAGSNLNSTGAGNKAPTDDKALEHSNDMSTECGTKRHCSEDQEVATEDSWEGLGDNDNEEHEAKRLRLDEPPGKDQPRLRKGVSGLLELSRDS